MQETICVAGGLVCVTTQTGPWLLVAACVIVIAILVLQHLQDGAVSTTASRVALGLGTVAAIVIITAADDLWPVALLALLAGWVLEPLLRRRKNTE